MKAEAAKLREQRDKNYKLHSEAMNSLNSEKKRLEAVLEDKEKLLNADKEAVLKIRQKLERHVYDYVFLDNQLLSKFRMHKT